MADGVGGDKTIVVSERGARSTDSTCPLSCAATTSDSECVSSVRYELSAKPPPAVDGLIVKSRWAAVVPLLMMLMILVPSALRNAETFRSGPVTVACTRNAPGRM